MLRKLISVFLFIAITLGCAASALAESSGFADIEKELPTDPIITDGEYATITAEYSAETDTTRYSVALKESAFFPNGTSVTAEDLLFTYYTYLDPGCEQYSSLKSQNILGLESYLWQVTAEDIAAARAAMNAIDEAGREHAWSESDRWTKEIQDSYWTLYESYEAACEAEYPHCAQAIVDTCIDSLSPQSAGAFGLTAEEIAENTSLHVAYAMTCWGYAFAKDDDTLISTNTRTLWMLADGTVPTLNDFVTELKAVYDSDLGACWSVENPGNYEPTLPNLEEQFIAIYLGLYDANIPSIEGVRIDENGCFEIELDGIRMSKAQDLFGIDILSRQACGNDALWNPENDEYGHPFGDVSSVEACINPENTLHLLSETFDVFEN